MLYSPGQCIFREGEKGDSMYVLQDGALKIVVNDKFEETVGLGGVVGEMALFDDQTPSASFSRGYRREGSSSRCETL